MKTMMVWMVLCGAVGAAVWIALPVFFNQGALSRLSNLLMFVGSAAFVPLLVQFIRPLASAPTTVVGTPRGAGQGVAGRVLTMIAAPVAVWWIWIVVFVFIDQGACNASNFGGPHPFPRFTDCSYSASLDRALDLWWAWALLAPLALASLYGAWRQRTKVPPGGSPWAAGDVSMMVRERRSGNPYRDTLRPLGP